MTNIEKHALWVLRRLRKLSPYEAGMHDEVFFMPLAALEQRRFQRALRRNLALVTVVDWLLERGLASYPLGQSSLLCMLPAGLAFVRDHDLLSARVRSAAPPFSHSFYVNPLMRDPYEYI